MTTSPRQNTDASEIEVGLVGSVLLDGARVMPLAMQAGIGGGDFVDPTCKAVFIAAWRIHASGGIVDVLAIGDDLRQRGELDGIGGTAILDQLCDATPTSAHAGFYVERLAESARRRRLASAARNLASAVEDGGDPGEALAQLDAARATATNTSGLRVVSVAELMARPDIRREDFVGEGIVFRGGISAIIGQPGTHKTRLAIVAAVSCNLGVSVGSLKTCGHPVRWLILAGNENSEQRYRDDIRRMLPNLSDAEQRLVGDNVFLHVVSEVGDEIGPDSANIIEATCRQLKPDVVVVDPLGDLLTEDNGDVDMRRAVKTIAAACRRGSPETNPAVVFVHHARTGSVNTLQAVGWDRGNFGKGSKALLACCRAVVNVAPADTECAGIVLACGKVNDVHPFEPFAVHLDERGFYSTDEGFNLTTWQNDVAGKLPGVKVSPSDVLDVLRMRNNAASRGDLQADIIGRFGVTKRTANRRIAELIENRTLKEHRDGIITPAEKALYAANR